MRLVIGRSSLEIIPESEQDVAYIEDTLNIGTNDIVQLVRMDSVKRYDIKPSYPFKLVTALKKET